MDVYYVLVHEAPDDVSDRIALADVAEELVPQPLAPARPPHESRDIHEIDRRRHEALAPDDLRQRVQPFVRHHRDPEVRVYRGERVVLGLGPRPREAVKHRGLTHVGQPDYPYLHTVIVATCSKSGHG